MGWMKLSDHKSEVLHRGALIKFPRPTPTSSDLVSVAVYMVCESPSPPLKLGLMRIDGYDAGVNCYVVFPDEFHVADGFYGLVCQKVYDNWHNWVWPEGSPDNAWILPEGVSADDLK